MAKSKGKISENIVDLNKINHSYLLLKLNIDGIFAVLSFCFKLINNCLKLAVPK